MPAFDINKYPLISDQVTRQELEVICQNLVKILDVEISGEIVEFGCYSGTTSLFLQRILQARQSAKRLHVYDSFAGLPSKTAQDNSPAGTQFIAGELYASKKQFIQNFKKAGLSLPVIHKGWFKDLSKSDIPASIAFAFLDGDYYDSIMQSWRLISPSLSRGAIVIIDDFDNIALPGARRAVNDICRQNQLTISNRHSLAIFQAS